MSQHSPRSTTTSEYDIPTLSPLSNGLKVRRLRISTPARSPPSGLDVESITRHDRYYISSGDVIFQVENHLFRVHRYFFVRESIVFRDMLSMPSPMGSEPEGSSDAKPIVLPQVTSAEFAQFLWVFYNPKYSLYQATPEEWRAVLALAHLWQFEEVKQLAVREMEKLHIVPVDKAVWARDYDVDAERGWLTAAYAALGARAEPLTFEEGASLGLKVALQVAEVRERIRDRRHRNTQHHPSFGYSPIAASPAQSVGARSPDIPEPILEPEYTVEDLQDVRGVFSL